MTTIQQNWINFKTRFRTAHRKLKEIGELKMEDTGYHQSNPFNDVVSPMSGLPCPYPPQETAYNLVPNSAPTIVSTIQPTPLANVATYIVFNIIF